MIKCNSRFSNGKCVASMTNEETFNGAIFCDFAEDCNFDEYLILELCSDAVEVAE